MATSDRSGDILTGTQAFLIPKNADESSRASTAIGEGEQAVTDGGSSDRRPDAAAAGSAKRRLLANEPSQVPECLREPVPAGDAPHSLLPSAKSYQRPSQFDLLLASQALG